MKRPNRRRNLGEGVRNEEKVPRIIWTARYGIWNLLNFEDKIHIKGGENVKPDKNLVFGWSMLGRIEGYRPTSFGEKFEGRGPTYPKRE